jgi:hypothetical protein
LDILDVRRSNNRSGRHAYWRRTGRPDH